MLLTGAALLALPVADALGAPKPRVKIKNKVTVVREDVSDGLGRVLVTRSKQLTATVSVPYTLSSTSAAGGASCGGGTDFVSAAGTVTFGPGEDTKEILVQVCNDSIVEGGEYVNVSLTKPVPGVVVSGGTAQLAIADDDGPARVAFAGGGALVFENSGSVGLSVVRLGDPSKAVSVDYASSDGTATAADYTAANGTLNFPSMTATDLATATLQTINVALQDDAAAELDEDLSVALSNPRETLTSAPLEAATPSQSTVTIVDDDAPASIAFAVPTATVGEADGSVTVTLRRSGAPANWVTARYGTLDGIALEGWDYTRTVFEPDADPLFDPHEIETTFSVAITNDSLSEGDESFGLSLSDMQSDGPVGVSVRPSMNVTITDDEPAPATQPSVDAGGAASDAGAPAASGTPVDGSAATCGATVRAAKRQRVARRKAVVLRVSAKRACTIRARVMIKRGKVGSSAVRTKLVTKKLAAGRRTVMRLRLSRKAMRSVMRALRTKRAIPASLRVVSAPASGKAARRAIALRLTR
jgi:hypothetical protein